MVIIVYVVFTKKSLTVCQRGHIHRFSLGREAIGGEKSQLTCKFSHFFASKPNFSAFKSKNKAEKRAKKTLRVSIFCTFANEMKNSSYITLSKPSEAIYREKMSKFMVFAFPVRNEEEARAAIEDVRNRFHDARHVCWAYMLGADRSRSMLNDNGEPSGTAGKPILGQINSFGLTNVAVAVVRYFGGIKLGTSGLIGAYREATRLALEAAEKVEKCEEVTLSLTFGYLVMNDIMKLVKGLNLTVLHQSFDNICRMTLAVRRDQSADLAARFSGIDGVSAVCGTDIL